MTYTVRITGKRAVEYAEAHGMPIEHGGARIDRYDSDFRSTLEGDQDWDASADDGDAQVYVDIPAPYAVARYEDARATRLLDIEYFQSVEDGRIAFDQAEMPAGWGSRVRLVEVDEDGEPARIVVEKEGAGPPGR
jgi:hypothetical protein